jgi:hypothetical protein
VSVVIEPDHMTAEEPDSFVPDIQVRRELGNITMTTLRKWERDPNLNFPPPIRILERNYRSRRLLEEFKNIAIRRGATSTPPRGMPCAGCNKQQARRKGRSWCAKRRRLANDQANDVRLGTDGCVC